MAIELKFTGMCEGCDKAKLKLHEERYDCMMSTNYFTTYTVHCEYEQACKRIYDSSRPYKPKADESCSFAERRGE